MNTSTAAHIHTLRPKEMPFIHNGNPASPWQPVHMLNRPLSDRARQHAEAAERLSRGAIEHPEAAPGLLKCAELHARCAQELARGLRS